MRLIATLMTCSLLAGCATYQWRHGDGTRNFDADSYPCKQEAAKAFPPNIRERVARPASFQPPKQVCGTNNQCTWTPGYWEPERRESFDANAEQRDDMYNSCMKAKGWAYIRVD